MKKIIKLALSDFKIIFRDPSLKSFLVLPVVWFVLIIWAVPPLVYKFDSLASYVPLFLVIAVIENTQIFSFIHTMVMIDEKETEVAKVYGIVPLTKLEFLISRFVIPYLFTVLLNVALFLVQPFYQIPIGANLLISFLTAMVVPVYVLTINSIVQNRMQGMVYVKALNMVVLLPLAAFFVPEKMKHFFGIFPTHWIIQSVDSVVLGLPFGLLAGIGFLFLAGLLWFTSSVFIKKHFI